MGVHVSSDPWHWPMRELVTSACSPIGSHYQTKPHNNILSSDDDVLGPFLQKFISDKKHGIKKMEGTEKLSKSQKNTFENQNLAAKDQNFLTSHPFGLILW